MGCNWEGDIEFWSILGGTPLWDRFLKSTGAGGHPRWLRDDFSMSFFLLFFCEPFLSSARRCAYAAGAPRTARREVGTCPAYGRRGPPSLVLWCSRRLVFGLTVAEHARLFGCWLNGLGPQLPQRLLVCLFVVCLFVYV